MLERIDDVLRRAMLRPAEVVGCDDCLNWMHRYDALLDQMIEVMKDNITLHADLKREREQNMALKALAGWRPEKQHG